MNILQYCPAYRPSVGGLEFVVHTLAREFTDLGHKSRILTTQAGAWIDDAELGVVRRPGVAAQLAAIRWADAVVCHQDVLALAWPLALFRKPALMMIHVSPQQRRSPASLLMHHIAKHCLMNAASRSLAREVTDLFGEPCGVLPNPYDAKCFYSPHNVEARTIDFVFVGRLAFVKGADLFVESLAELAQSGLRPSVKIIGDGEDRPKIERLIQLYDLGAQVELLGVLEGVQIAEILRKTYCMVVPSRYEPFGIVSLEGRACGCKIIATDAGGLPEASGADAIIVPHSNLEALAPALQSILEQKDSAREAARTLGSVDVSLVRHEPRSVAAAFLESLESQTLNKSG
jgi:glycogen(starch) synthase